MISGPMPSPRTMVMGTLPATIETSRWANRKAPKRLYSTAGLRSVVKGRGRWLRRYSGSGGRGFFFSVDLTFTFGDRFGVGAVKPVNVTSAETVWSPRRSSNLGGVPFVEAADERLQLLRVGDFFAGERDDAVAGFQFGLGGGRVGGDAFDHRRALPCLRPRAKLNAELSAGQEGFAGLHPRQVLFAAGQRHGETDARIVPFDAGQIASATHGDSGEQMPITRPSRSTSGPP